MLVAIVVMLFAGGSFVAQGVLMQLGLTESSARNFVLDEIKHPADGRRSDIVVAGTRGFVNLPRAARGPAATMLFAWAKGYVNSASFKTAYDTFARAPFQKCSSTTSPSNRKSREGLTSCWPNSRR